MSDTPFGSSNSASIRAWINIPRIILEYIETSFETMNELRIEKAGGAVTRRDRGSTEFAGRLTTLVDNMLRETVTVAKSAQTVSVIPISGFQSFSITIKVDNLPSTRSRSWIWTCFAKFACHAKTRSSEEWTVPNGSLYRPALPVSLPGLRGRSE